MHCAACGFENPEGFRFCGQCGTSLTAAPGVEAERRQLTVVFTDLVDSTALAERLDPEELRELVAAYQRAVGEVVERYDGHVAQLLGDGILAYFGYPRAHEDDAQRAIHAGLDIVAAVERSAPRWMAGRRAAGRRAAGRRATGRRAAGRRATGREVAIAVRVGIHTGNVVAGEMGSGRTRERLALGDTPNIAARLQAAAGPGEVLASEATIELSRGLFRLESRGDQPMKGLSRPVRLHRVVAPLDRSRFEAAMASRTFTPHVGRDAELAMLRAAFVDAAAGRPRAVLLTGDAGIGKSRLVHRFSNELAEWPHHWWTLRCSALAQTTALDPVVGWIHRVFGTYGARPDEQRRLLQDGLGELGVDDREAVDLLVHLLGFATEGSGERSKQRTFEVLRGLVAAAARRRPVALVVDDLHWADPSTLELLDDVLAAPPAERLLLLLVTRPGGPPTRREGARLELEELRLERLDDRQVRQLIAGLTGGSGLPAALEREIVERTDGVPLFVEELTRAVIEGGLVRAVGGGFELAAEPRGLVIPTTLEGSLMSRLDRLRVGKPLAQLGAVLGRTFSFAMIAAVADVSDRDLATGLDELVSAELLRSKGQPPRATYWFRHALIHDVAYESLLRRRRRDLHAAVADAIQSLFPELAAQRPEELARHLTEAGELDHAARCWLAAGRKAAGASAHREALAHLQRARQVLAELPPSTDRDRLELEILVVYAPCLSAVRGYFNPEVESTFQDLIALAERLGEAERSFWPFYNLVVYHFVGSRLDRALELMTRLADLVATSDDATLLAQAQYGLGSTRYFRGELAAADRHLRRAIELDLPSRERAELRHTGLDIGVIARAVGAEVRWQLGHADEALEMARAAVALARELDQPVSLSVALLYLALVHAHRGETSAARRVAEEQVALAAEQELFHGCLGGMLLGRLEAVAGETAAGTGIERLERSLAAYQAGGRLGLTQYLSWLGEAHLARGERAAARRRLDEGIALAEGGERFWLPELLRLRAEADDDPDAAAVLRDRGAALAAAGGAVALGVRLAAGAAEVHG